jgi:ABC-2 type transport system ATP-binding protein
MVQISSLKFWYNRNTLLFSDLNCTLKTGAIYGLLGKNGAGKTSLLHLIAGLRFPKSGRCTVMGFESSHRTVSMLQDIYFIPEEFSLLPVTPEKYESLYAPFYPRFSHEQFAGYTSEFGLDLSGKLNSFSFGQKKKFLIAFGLATNCRLLLLDEPTNGLDIPSKSQFRSVATSAHDSNRIFIISTHQVRDMETLIDPVIILDEGEIVFNKKIKDIASALRVSLVPAAPSGGNVLYSEEAQGGYRVVSLGDGGDETSDIDLELLFNTVIANRDTLDHRLAAERKHD